MNIATECHPDPMLVLNGPKPDSPAGIVYRAASLFESRAAKLDKTAPWVVQPEGADGVEVDSDDHSVFIAATGSPDDSCAVDVAEFIAALNPEVALAIVASWEHLADDMNDSQAHFHRVPIGWTVVDEYGQSRDDWTATVRAALKYLRETAPVVA